ncbi:MAG TPA: Ig-like domain-containing protein [Trebonia sp.]|nr:Ig-like domain-containing protein [Trebonia sp.]
MQGRANPAKRARTFAAAAAAAVALVVTACAHAPSADQLNPRAVAPRNAAQVAKYLSITPAPGATAADPAKGITVRAENGGKLGDVTVTAHGDKVTGALNASRTQWHSAWTLHTDAGYTVTATGTDSQGHPVTETSSFRTLNPRKTFSTAIYEGYNETYGVGMPVMLTFTQPITDKAAVERSLRLTTSKPVAGSWYWDGDEHLDFRPRDYWPADTTVSFDGHLEGVDGGDGMYGSADLTQTFNVGQSVIAVASTTSHKTRVYVGGQLTYTWPVSTGRSTMPTPDGTYLTVQKGNPVRMTGGTKGKPGYYNELVNWAVRFTFSGDYYHSAPWSVVSQGYSNVSHGCVNLSPADARTLYEMAIPGDPVTITSSGKGGDWDDGWTEWFDDWHQYLAGSALHEAVEAGPHGSTFVSPSALPADTATAPTGTSAAGNYLAS